MRARKRPVEIEFLEWKNYNWEEMKKFCPTAILSETSDSSRFNLIIPTLEGNHLALRGDMIIKGIAGEFYPCKPDIFEKTYDSVIDPDKEIFSEHAKLPIRFDEYGGYFFDSNNNMIGEIRGWGKLQKLDNATEIQDAIGRHIAKCINSNI